MGPGAVATSRSIALVVLGIVAPCNCIVCVLDHARKIASNIPWLAACHLGKTAVQLAPDLVVDLTEATLKDDPAFS